MPLSVKGLVAILAGALPALFSWSHALRQEVSQGSASHEFKTLTALGWITPATTATRAGSVTHAGAVRSAFRWSHQQVPASAAADTEVWTSSTTRRARLRTECVRCRAKRPRTGPLQVAGVEGPSPAAVGPPAAAAAAATTSAAAATAAAGSKTVMLSAAAGADCGQAATRGVSVNGGVASRVADGDMARDFLVATAVASATVAGQEQEEATPTRTAVTGGVDEGEATCLQLGDVVSRDAEVAGQRVRLRVATLEDYLAIADVRFDVFSPVHSTLKLRFRERSSLLMRERRLKGAFCLVVALESGAVAPSDGRGDLEVQGELGEGEGVTGMSNEHVLGTLECSRHEFDDTPLAMELESGPKKIERLYLTEVAVRSDCRRLGVGRVLLGLVDDVAKQLETSEVFLHVNEVNEAALRLYARCGYEDAPECVANRAFTNSLGLSGGFIGQRHRLLHKIF